MIQFQKNEGGKAWWAPREWRSEQNEARELKDGEKKKREEKEKKSTCLKKEMNGVHPPIEE